MWNNEKMGLGQFTGKIQTELHACGQESYIQGQKPESLGYISVADTMGLASVHSTALVM